MRLLLALSAALFAAAPASAEVETDFVTANRIFGQVSASAVTGDIAGEWLPLTTLTNAMGTDPEPGLAESALERFCGNDPMRGAVITAIDEASFAMTEPNSADELTYRFDWIGGAQFHRSFDPEALFRLRRFDTMEGERGMEMRARTLEALSQPTAIYRIAPDLMAIATPQRVEIFGRCPA